MREVLKVKAQGYLKIASGKISDLKISARLALFYLLILIASMTLSNILYQEIYSNITLNKVSEVSVQTLYSIRANLNLMINNINNYSKIILSDNDVQSLLRNGNIYSDLDAQGRVSNFLYKLIQDEPSILSVYLFDNEGHKYSVNNQSSLKFLPARIEMINWFGEVYNKKGNYILRLNGGGAFRHDPDVNFMSMIRQIRDINTTRPIGVLIINISEDAFKNSFSNIVNNYATGIAILDEKNDSIVKLKDIDKNEINNLIKGFENTESGFKLKKLKNVSYLVSYLAEQNYNWKIISLMPASLLSSETAAPGVAGFAIILVNSLILFFGSVFVSRMFTIPIKKLLKSMKGVEKGEFREVDIRAGHNEIGMLRDGYNKMINEIQELIKSVIEEQKIKRKAELDVLQAQIKPHFLYNTLGSINSLALMGKSEDVCNIVDALGNYYRLSLSKGKEIITIGEEIDIVRNYLTIQQARFGDIFSVRYDLDDRCTDHKVLKLILQPLVENALYHGIRSKGEPGTISISSRLSEDHILLMIEDDGIGISEAELSKILSSRIGSDSSSFGLRGTIERLRIYYGYEDAFSIESEINIGTKITIKIPAGEENEEDGRG